MTLQPEPSFEAASAAGASDELKQKHQRIQQLMKERSLDALLISRHENIAWASAGLVDVRVGLARETGAGSLLFTSDGPSFYLTGSNEARRLTEEEFDGLEFQPIIQPWWANDVSLSVRQVIGSGKVAGDVALAGVELISLQPLRLSLMDREIDRYRWLGRHAADAVSDVLQNLQPGISEVTMQSMLLARLLADGILPTVSLTATDDRIRSYRHAVPRKGVLRQFGMLGFCARRWGLTVSMTRFVHFGEMPAERDEKFRTVAYVSARLLPRHVKARSVRIFSRQLAMLTQKEDIRGKN